MEDLPTRAEIDRFLEVSRVLSDFEAGQRFIRGYGAFRAEDCPIPEVLKVTAWLRTFDAEKFFARLADAERSLAVYDDGGVSEYWLRYNPLPAEQNSATGSATTAEAEHSTEPPRG